jgi:hypothetical protein
VCDAGYRHLGLEPPRRQSPQFDLLEADAEELRPLGVVDA